MKNVTSFVEELEKIFIKSCYTMVPFGERKRPKHFIRLC